jgi:hypothetical protein
MSSAIDAELGRRIIGLAEIADQARGRGEVYERAGILLAEVTRGGMRGVERAHQMDLDDHLEGVDRHLVEDRVAQDAGIVHHTVDAAIGVHRLLDDLAGRNGFGDRLEIGDGGAAGLGDFLDDFFRRCGAGAGAIGGHAGIVDDDLGTFSGAEHRNAAADAASRAGDDDDLAVEHFGL